MAGPRNFDVIGNATLALTTASASLALPTGGRRDASQVLNLRLYLEGGATAYFNLGTSAVVAVAGGTATNAAEASTFLAPGVVEFFLFRPGHTHIAAVAASTGTLRITVGEGD